MENENKSLVKSAETRLPKFVEDAYESVEKMERFAEILLNSKLVPNHFYEKLSDGKPDFSKGKTPAVVAVLIQGYQLQLPPLTALQHIIPVNGLLSIKGDLAKSMIFNSGKLKPGSWVEEETGTIEAGDYMVKITATRADNGQTLSRSFSVGQAKRAGLWITEQQVNGQDGWKYKSSAWWKYPTRMCNYRALGFIARDMFPDVMAGIYTTEEAMDIPKDTVEVIETESGSKIIIPDKEHAQKRSGKMTDRVADKIPDNKFGKVNENIQDAEVVSSIANGFTDPLKDMVEKSGKYPREVIDAMSKAVDEQNQSPFNADKGSAEYMNGVLVLRDPNTGTIINQDEIDGITGKEEIIPGKWTLKQMEDMETKKLLEMVNEDMDMMEACEMIGGKNTNKKLREILFAHQNGNLAEYVAKNLPQENKGDAPGMNDQGGKVETEGSGFKPNKEFDSQGPNIKQVKGELFPGADGGKGTSTNKYGIVVPEFDKGNTRDFATMKQLFNAMASITPQVNNPHYLDLASKMGIVEKYPSREDFCKNASVDEINALLNTN
jgi:hypothetical protein